MATKIQLDAAAKGRRLDYLDAEITRLRGEWNAAYTTLHQTAEAVAWRRLDQMIFQLEDDRDKLLGEG